MKKLIATILVISIILLNVNSVHAITYAWWVTIEYEPEKTEILGIPIADLDPTWIRAELLSIKDAVPPEELQDFKRDTSGYGFSFVKEGDFNSDGKQDKAVVGVYKKKNGDVGRFLLILTKYKGKKWVKSSLLQNPGKAGFSILAIEQGALAWYVCMECDIFSLVKWENGKYILEPFDCC